MLVDHGFDSERAERFRSLHLKSHFCPDSGGSGELVGIIGGPFENCCQVVFTTVADSESSLSYFPPSDVDHRPSVSDCALLQKHRTFSYHCRSGSIRPSSCSPIFSVLTLQYFTMSFTLLGTGIATLLRL